MPLMLNQKLLAIAGVMCSVGCTTWDSEVVFPEGFTSSFITVHECQPSGAHVAADYVVTWLSPEGEEAWASMMEGVTAGAEPTDLPVGTVLVKAQYDDSDCSQLSGYTAMEKLEPNSNPELGDYRWQFVDADGSCKDCNAKTECSGCHAAPNCGAAFPYVCTSPTSEAVTP